MSALKNSAGLKVGMLGSRASSTGAVHSPSNLRDHQMATSGLPSVEPPNQAARNSPEAVSTLAESWQEGKGED